jgi:hypothetical protein
MPAPSWPRLCSAPGPTPDGSTPRPRSRCSPAWRPSPPTATSHQPLSTQLLRRPPAQPGAAHVVQSRIRYDCSTRDYVARRTTERKTGREIKRCLSRYIARDLYRLLESGPITA